MTLNANALRWPLAQDSRHVDWTDRQAADSGDEYAEDGGSTFAYWEAVNVADRDGGDDLWAIVRSGWVTHVHIGDDDPDYDALLPVEDVEGWSWAGEDDAETERRELIHSRVTLFVDDAQDYAPGPQMNYAYPVINDVDDNERDAEWAYAIRHLPLCVVELDGFTGLALTGGGMDLSWEIAEAFLRIGYRPPVDICGDLPADADGVNDTRRVVVNVVTDTLRKLADGYTYRADALAEKFSVQP